MPPKRVWGVCFPGGGARGAFQAGAAYELFRWFIGRDIVPHAVSMASVGTLNGLMFVQGFEDGGHSVRALETLWGDLRKDKVRGLVPHFLPWSRGLFHTRPLKRLIRDNIDVALLRQSPIQFHVGATRYGSGPDITVGPDDPRFLDVVLASASFPIVFKPVRIDGAVYADKGLKNNWPIGELVRAGCDTIVLLRTSPHESSELDFATRDPRLLEQLEMLATEMMEVQLPSQLDVIVQENVRRQANPDDCQRLIEVIDFHAPNVPNLGTLEFDGHVCREAFEAARSTMRTSLHAESPALVA